MSSPEERVRAERARAEYRENVRRGVAMDRPRLLFFLGVMGCILVLLALIGWFQDRFPDFLSPAPTKSSTAPVDESTCETWAKDFWNRIRASKASYHFHYSAKDSVCYIHVQYVYPTSLVDELYDACTGSEIVMAINNSARGWDHYESFEDGTFGFGTGFEQYREAIAHIDEAMGNGQSTLKEMKSRQAQRSAKHP